ncbi:MAG: HlyD family efflux transporter periplasmic adaptor subunit [Acidobacteriota bacterium]
MRKFIIRLIILLVLVGASYAAYRVYQALPQRQESIATAKVKQGDVVVRSFARGELRAVRSATLTAPNLFGTVQVTKLATLGSLAREKDLVVEFDDAEVLSRLEEKQLELDQIDEQVKKAQADLAIRDNQDQVELLRARYSVRRAELEVKRNELISAIDAKKNQLTLEESKRRLSQLESDIKSRREQAQAELAVLREKRNKATLELNREKQRLAQVKLIAPMAGLVAVKQNRSTVMMFGMQLPDIREGDQVQPGMPVADILDLSEMEVVAKVGELDRANLVEGQEVSMRLDAIPDKTFTGKIKSMSGTASANMFSSDPAKKFDVIFSIDMRQLLSALGANEAAVNRILAQAEVNRKKGPMTASSSMPMMGEMGGGPPAGGMMMAGGAPGHAGEGGQRQRGQNGGGQNGDPETQRKRREIITKLSGGKSMADMSPEERAEMMTKVSAEMQKLGMAGGNRGGGANRAPGMPQMFNIGGFLFSQKDLDSAKLPPPPEEDNQLDVLLRPGLLADVQIIVDKVPNAINIPIQSLFEKEGKAVVYVKNGTRFEPREVKPLKRSENVMIIASGLKAGETIAMADPEAKPGDKKKKTEGKAGGAASALPGGKGGM